MLLATDTPFLVSEGIDFHGWMEVQVTVGVNPALLSRLQGTGIPCVLAWPPNQPGIILEVDPDQLIEAGFPESEVWKAAGCGWGIVAEPSHPDHLGEPLCIECLACTPGVGEDDEFPKLAEEEQGICWSCIADNREWFAGQTEFQRGGE